MLNENEIVDTVCHYLETAGYSILSRCTTTDHGIDIIAQRPSEASRLLIEAKGGTSARKGSARYNAGFSGSRSRVHVAKAFYQVAALYAAHHNAGDSVGMAFPDTRVHRLCVSKIGPVANLLGCAIFFAKDDHSVERLD